MNELSVKIHTFLHVLELRNKGRFFYQLDNQFYCLIIRIFNYYVAKIIRQMLKLIGLLIHFFKHLFSTLE